MLLRGWREDDLVPFAAMGADPEVMEHFPHTLPTTESAEVMARIQSGLHRDGFGFWALEVPGEVTFGGFLGISPVPPEMPFSPSIEIGWRMARPLWGRGLATEAATGVVEHAFTELSMSELVAYTAVGNARSRRVMARLGMERDPGEDFLHPNLPPEHRLAPHVLYRLTAEDWERNKLEPCAADTRTRRDRKS
ncbi:MAG TPA: GNAT family N-acetyltransferase [Solirubrobacteraceae bacterium]|nr:GNAT family N-acetyltransferase [Solirubrobacteraceae bacterium]